jgi:glucose-6-phosphate 1-dehydrogenase
MEQIKPTVVGRGMICEELAAGPGAVVVFGASGDLVGRKLLVSFFQLLRRGLLSEQFYILGCGRKEFTNQQFQQKARESIQQSVPEVPAELLKSFTDKLYYISGDYGDTSLYEGIKSALGELDKKHKVDGCRVFYLAVPPLLYETIAQQLGLSGLSESAGGDSRSRIRLVVEKPFGRDLQTAAELNSKIGQYFEESQIYRIDHYLGKETVQNILIFRFANTIFEPVWNRNYIDSVQITIAERLGVEHRASYYDQSGALRDMFQNHMLQMLSMVAMEPPTSFVADRIRDEKVKLLRSVRPFGPEPFSAAIVRGRYGAGQIDGKKVLGYRQEPGISALSTTETYVAAKLFVDNWRWKDVPFYLRTGKRLAGKDTEIAITFKEIPHSMFISAGLDNIPSNVLVLQIQPQEGISLNFQAKRPGSKICIGTLNMNFSYTGMFGVDMPQAYERLLLDCLTGDQTLFTRYDSVEASWQLLEPVLESWKSAQESAEPYEYPAGAESFARADRLIEADGRKWRKLGEL